MVSPRVAPQDVKPQPREDVSAGMKEAVPERVDLQVLNTVRRIARACQHMMPLKDLVQDNTIKEPAQTQSEQDASGNRKAAILRQSSHNQSLAACTEWLARLSRSCRPGPSRPKSPGKAFNANRSVSISRMVETQACAARGRGLA